MFNVAQPTILRHLRKMGVKVRNYQYEMKISEFGNIDCEWKAYFWGMLLADGCIYKNCIQIALHKEDIAVLDYINDKFFVKNKVRKSKSLKGNNAMVLTLENKSIIQEFRRLGLEERKSLTLQLPPPNIVPDHLFHHFVRGYFDGDGWVTKSGGSSKHVFKFGIVSSDDFCKQLKIRLNRMGYNRVNLGKTTGCKVSYLIISAKTDFVRFARDLYKDASFWMKRKKDLVDEMCKDIEENMKTRPPQSSCTGVTFNKGWKKWAAHIKINKIQYYLGQFKNEQDAINKRLWANQNRHLFTPDADGSAWGMVKKRIESRSK
jgi:hypothetical protein